MSPANTLSPAERDDIAEIITAPPPVTHAEARSTFGRRTPAIPRPSSLSRELKRSSAQVTSQDPATPADDGNNQPPPPTTSVWERLVLQAVYDPVRPGTPPPTNGEAMSPSAQRDVDTIRAAFEFRVKSHPIHLVNVTPSGRDTFEKMLWTVMIISTGGAPAGYQHPAISAHKIPVIQQSTYCITRFRISEEAQLLENNLDLFLSHTEALLRNFPLPSYVAISFAAVASGINTTSFAKYVGTRGHWSLHRCYGGLLILLRWWAATSPLLMMEYRSALSMKNTDTFMREKLRAELCDVLEIGVHEEKFERKLAQGLDVVASFRREMHKVVLDMFETLIDTERGAKPAEVRSNTMLIDAE